MKVRIICSVLACLFKNVTGASLRCVLSQCTLKWHFSIKSPRSLKQSQCWCLVIHICHICTTMPTKLRVEKQLWGILEPGPGLHNCTCYPHWPHINPRNHISDCVGTRIPRRNPKPNGENVRTETLKSLPLLGTEPRTFSLWGDMVNQVPHPLHPPPSVLHHRHLLNRVHPMQSMAVSADVRCK